MRKLLDIVIVCCAFGGLTYTYAKRGPAEFWYELIVLFSGGVTAFSLRDLLMGEP